ncbi:uncharacterized protein [Oscarella lobularis]|uniref:uncharacterized protein n=1 Tax=Oscarella lobularis TaxID=121494 RepID=UPI003313863C
MRRLLLVFLAVIVVDSSQNDSLVFRILHEGNKSAPEPRKNAAAAYDSRTKRLIVFGGIDATNSATSNDLWTFDLQKNAWKKYPSCHNASFPPALFLSVSGLDETSYTFTIATGCDATTTLATDDAYRVDLSSLYNPKTECIDWIKLNSTKEKRCDSSGGIDADGRLFFAFETENESLLKATSFSSPRPRRRQASAIVKNNSLLIHGGCLEVGFCPSADSWILTGDRWDRVGGCSPPRMDAAMAVLNGYAVLYGGLEASEQSLNGVKYSSGDEVALLELSSKPSGWFGKRARGGLSARGGHSMVSASGYGVIVFGGEIDGKGLSSDVWLLTGDPSQDDDDDRERVVISCSNGLAYFHLHGILMFAAYAVFMPIAIIVVRYRDRSKETRKRFLIVHVVFQSAVTLLASAGLYLAIVSYSRADRRRRHFQFVHAILGVALYLLTVGQIIWVTVAWFIKLASRKAAATVAAAAGGGTDKRGKQDGIYRLWKSVHVAVGILIVLLAVTNVSLGLLASLVTLPYWATWFGLLAFYILIILVLDCRKLKSVYAAESTRKGC